MQNGGSLLDHPKFIKGNKYVVVKIAKIGLKEAPQYMDPFLSVFVCGKQFNCYWNQDEHGNPIGPSQDTPISNKKHENYIEFDCKVNIQSSVNEFTQGFT